MNSPFFASFLFPCFSSFTMSKQSSSSSFRQVRSIPLRLLNFFEKYPPPALFPHHHHHHASLGGKSLPTTTTTTSSSSSSSSSTSTIGLAVPSEGIETHVSKLPLTGSETMVPSTSPANVPAHAHDLPYPNPFLPRKNFVTGRWHGPKYGLRKQADLVKLASRHGVVDLLPWTVKKPDVKQSRRVEQGLRVKGTGEGQRVKGHLWERTLKGRLAVRRQAMLNMSALVEEWKWKGHGRSWKKWPSSGHKR